jgi:integrase
VNHHRTIVNGIFNFAVKRGKFDRNPVAAVPQRREPPGRDRIVSPEEFRGLWDAAGGDPEMRAFLALAGTTTMQKGEILSLRWDRLHLENAPYATLVRTKTGHQRRPDTAGHPEDVQGSPVVRDAPVSLSVPTNGALP